MNPIIKSRLTEIQLGSLAYQIIAWIERDLEGVDAMSVEAILGPDYVVAAVRCAVAEMVHSRRVQPVKGEESEIYSRSQSDAFKCTWDAQNR